MAIILPAKDPDAVEPYFIVWCDEGDGTNDGSSSDGGELQGATISTVTWTVPTGITKDSETEDAVTIKGVSYDANTVTTIWLSSGTPRVEYEFQCVITTSDSRTLTQSIVIPVRSN